MASGIFRIWIQRRHSFRLPWVGILPSMRARQGNLSSARLTRHKYSNVLSSISSPVKNYICLPVIPIVCHLYHSLATINIHLFIYLFRLAPPFPAFPPTLLSLTPRAFTSPPTSSWSRRRRQYVISMRRPDLGMEKYFNQRDGSRRKIVVFTI